MPIYEYRCVNGHEFEVFQSMSEHPVTLCGECGAQVERVFRPVAVHFKGSGFYTTDYAKSGAEPKPSGDGDTAGDSDSGKADKKADSSKSGDSTASGEKAKASSSD